MAQRPATDDDHTTARQRLRQARRAEVAKLYEKRVEPKLASGCHIPSRSSGPCPEVAHNGNREAINYCGQVVESRRPMIERLVRGDYYSVSGGNVGAGGSAGSHVQGKSFRCRARQPAAPGTPPSPAFIDAVPVTSARAPHGGRPLLQDDSPTNERVIVLRRDRLPGKPLVDPLPREDRQEAAHREAEVAAAAAATKPRASDGPRPRGRRGQPAAAAGASSNPITSWVPAPGEQQAAARRAQPATHAVDEPVAAAEDVPDVAEHREDDDGVAMVDDHEDATRTQQQQAPAVEPRKKHHCYHRHTQRDHSDHRAHHHGEPQYVALPADEHAGDFDGAAAAEYRVADVADEASEAQDDYYGADTVDVPKLDFENTAAPQRGQVPMPQRVPSSQSSAAAGRRRPASASSRGSCGVGGRPSYMAGTRASTSKEYQFVVEKKRPDSAASSKQQYAPAAAAKGKRADPYETALRTAGEHAPGQAAVMSAAELDRARALAHKPPTPRPQQRTQRPKDTSDFLR